MVRRRSVGKSIEDKRMRIITIVSWRRRRKRIKAPPKMSISPTFYDHLFSPFHFAKKLQTQTVRTEKLHKSLSYKKAARKMLVKLPPKESISPNFVSQTKTHRHKVLGKKSQINFINIISIWIVCLCAPFLLTICQISLLLAKWCAPKKCFTFCVQKNVDEIEW